MPWTSIDDGLYDHPKTLAAGPEALGLWVAALSYVGRHYRLRGALPHAALYAIFPTLPIAKKRRLAARLVEVGLWEVHPKGWLFHDYFDCNRTPEQIEADRAATRERQAKFRARHGDRDTKAGPDEARNGVTNGATNGVSNGAPVPSRPDPDPTRPDPNPTGPTPTASAVMPAPPAPALVERVGDERTRRTKSGATTVRTVYPADSEPYALAVFLRRTILANAPDARVPAETPEALAGWSLEMFRMLQYDQRTPAAARALMQYALRHHYWRGVIRSAGKFRFVWDRIAVPSGGEPIE